MNYGPINPKMKSMLHGADYNPDQWINYDNIWDEDIRLMKLSHSNAMSIGIFSWSSLEPTEGNYDFSWMDKIMDKLSQDGIYTVLATPSGARPTWMSYKYPEVLRVSKERVKHIHGARHNHCFTSPIYRKKTKSINEQLALRYKDHPALLIWHISNELGGECHCELCQEAFRNWLKVKYDNNLDKLNHEWWTTFWSHVYTDWSQIESPSPIGENGVHGHNLDWKRFVTHQTIDFIKNEIEPLRRITPLIPITTNFMHFFNDLDYFKLAKELDIVSWDSYPQWHTENEITTAMATAFWHDLNRSLKGGKPFMLMESTPSLTNWQAASKLKRPGMHLLSSIQAIAHGSDTVQYFQWRKSRGSSEKFHGAVVDHCGHEHTRVFKDVTDVGLALSRLDDLVGTSVKPEVAILYDWDNKWSFEDAQGLNNSSKAYIETQLSHYKPFWQSAIPVDIIDSEMDFKAYKLLIAPILYMIKPGVSERIDAFVKAGGTFITTYCSGIVNENDLCHLGGFPGPLKPILGIWAEETDSLPQGQLNHVSVNAITYTVKDMCDLIHLETAQELGHYSDDFYAKRPALTKNNYGNGSAYYIAFRNNDTFETDFYKGIIQELGLKKLTKYSLPEGVTIQTRYDNINRFLFLMNFSKKEQTVQLDKEYTYTNQLTGELLTSYVLLAPYEVIILKQS